MTLDHNGNEVALPTETIKPIYHKPEQHSIAPVIQGYRGDVDTRHVYTKDESASISQTAREPAIKKAK